VSGLAQEFPGRVRASNVDATTAEAKRAMEGLGFRSHGLVIRSGGGTVLWTQADHQVDLPAVRAKLSELLAGR
jgi:hypothetical protein